MINTFVHNFGLSEDYVLEVIENKFNENADILMGIDDPEVNQLIQVLIRTTADIILENNNKIKSDIENYINNIFKDYFREYLKINI